MLVKFFWSTAGQPAEAICEVTIKTDAVPREGELVDINYQTQEGEPIQKMGRVLSVTWYYSKKSIVTVQLS